MRGITKILAAILLFALPAGASCQTLRIGLVRHFKDIPSVTVSSTTNFCITDPSGNAVASAAAAQKVTLSVKNGAMQLARPDADPMQVKGQLEVASSSPDGVIILSAADCPRAQYRGKIVAKSDQGGISLINVVDLEEYLRGVLPSEMSSEFNIEALKAQAVASRTYAWAHRNRHAKLGYDLCDSTDCQVYLGAAGEKPYASEAIKQTEGLVIVHEGRLISARYCSDCGGRTQDGGEPYLNSVADRPEDGGPDYCEHEGHTWSKSWPLDELEKLLRKSYPELKGLKSLSVTETDSTGRAREVKTDAEAGATTLSGVQLRKLLGNSVIKSTAFTVDVKNRKVIFEGKGFGHGVGLCQFGANGLAAPPHNYTFEQILKHYYRGTEIISLSSME